MQIQKDQTPVQKILKKWSLSLVAFLSILAAVFITDRAARPERAYMISDRGINQSLRNVASSDSDLLNWDLEREFANKLARYSIRKPATVGKAGTERERFQFGFLQGRYRLTNDPQHSDRIWKLEFSPSDDASVAAIEVGNLAKFLEKYQLVFAVEFAKAERKDSSYGLKQSPAETFKLIDRAGRETGYATLVLNPQGGLISVEFGRL